jgi:hypothetical protein
MNIDFAALGFTKEDLQNRVVDQLCDRLLSQEGGDEEGHSWINESKLQKDLDELVRQRIDERVTALANEHVLPNVQAIIENWTLQETSQWGEKKGRSFTFTEYLVSRADAYMREDVDANGKAKDGDSYNWKKHSSRMAHAINAHLQYQIQSAMKEALEKANKSLDGAMESAARQAMIETASKLSLKLELKK